MEILNRIVMVFAQTEGPAETTGYMIAGFSVIFGVMLLYLISIAVRTRNQRQEYDLLQSIEHKKSV